MGQRRINTKPESNTCKFVYAEDDSGKLVRVPLAQINFISKEDARKVKEMETAIGAIKSDDGSVIMTDESGKKYKCAFGKSGGKPIMEYDEILEDSV